MDSLIKMGEKAYKKLDKKGGKKGGDKHSGYYDNSGMAYYGNNSYGPQYSVHQTGQHPYPGPQQHVAVGSHPYPGQQGYTNAPQPVYMGQQHGQPPPPPGGQMYGQYGNYYSQNVYTINAWEVYQYKQPSDLEAVFTNEMSKNPENAARGAIQAEDLMNVLNNTPSIRDYYKLNWSREMCSIMIAMLDRSQDGFMQWAEFLELQQCLVAWYRVFCQHDFDRSGFIDAAELIRVIKQLFGYHIQPQTLETILKRYSRVVPPNARCIIAFDDFVTLAVRLRAYTDAFRKRDSASHGGVETGSCQMGYDDFLRCVMCL